MSRKLMSEITGTDVKTIRRNVIDFLKMYENHPERLERLIEI